MKDIKKTIGQQITALRTANKMTQAELAEQLNYSDKSISKWERGESIPDISVLKKIADIFSVSVDYLTKEPHEDTNPIVEPTIPKKGISNRSKAIITALSTLGVLFIAAFICMMLKAFEIVHAELSFVYAIPACLIVLLIFNSLWGKRALNFVIISLLIWSIISILYVVLIRYKIWMLFIIGGFGQVAVLLSIGFFKKSKP